ncbi:MAG TPA: hypothetical protein VF131_01225 [Blastocatellia bacterium]|nr:hypothetical protein [Blastocatellia bacterium]
MKIQKVLKGQIVRASVLAMLFISLCSVPSKSYLADMSAGDNVTLPGVHGASNNTAYAFDRYVIVAPFAPTQDVGDGSDLSKFDNHKLYLFDTKKPENPPLICDLKVCYFPTRVIFDPNTQNVYVRGTEFVEIEAGRFEAREVLVYTHLNLALDGKPTFVPDLAVPIRIKGLISDYTEDAPTDFALGHSGRILVFTNGSWIFTYDVVKGTIYHIVIDNDPLNLISHLEVEPTSNTITVATSRRLEGAEGGVIKFESELYFYKLEKDGTANKIKQLRSEEFGEGIFLSAGSNAVVSTDPITGTAEFGYFVTNDGSLCQVDLRSEGDVGRIERLAVLPEMAQAEGLEPGPVTVNFDRAKRQFTIVKRGTFTKIRRPSYAERSGRIRRPSYTEYDGGAAVAIVQLNKKNRVIGQRVFDKVFGKENRLSNLVVGQNGMGLIATYSGLVFALDSSTTLDRASVSFVGSISTRIDHIAYNASRQNLTAISSYKDIDEIQGIVPGSIFFTKVSLNAD